jgi:hypothetical protein
LVVIVACSPKVILPSGKTKIENLEGCNPMKNLTCLFNRISRYHSYTWPLKASTLLIPLQRGDSIFRPTSKKSELWAVNTIKVTKKGKPKAIYRLLWLKYCKPSFKTTSRALILEEEVLRKKLLLHLRN